jgi:hypothetical protein
MTNMSFTYLCNEAPVAMTQNFSFGLTSGLGIENDLVKVTHDFRNRPCAIGAPE